MPGRRFRSMLPRLRTGRCLRCTAGKSVAEQLSTHAAKGEWGEMFGLITDEILGTFCLVTDAESLPEKLKERYNGIADRLTLYTPFVPGEKDEFWKKLVEAF